MRSHENYEETKLYPFLVRRFGVSLKYLSSEHDEMHTKSNLVVKYMNEYIALETTSAAFEIVVEKGARLLDAMNNYDKLLKVHLMEEEDIVIPLLMEMDVVEFDEFVDNSLSYLIKKLDKEDKKNGIK